MPKVMLLIQDGYGTAPNPMTGQKLVKTDVQLGPNQHVRQVVVHDFEPDEDGSVRVGEDRLPAIPHEYINHLVGKVLTVTDASTPDPIQRRAIKDLVSQAIWNWYQGHRADEPYGLLTAE